MPKFIFALLLILFSSTNAATQILISPDLELGNQNQIHILITHNEDEFIGRVYQIKNDSLFFSLERLKQELTFSLQEVHFIGLLGESIDDYKPKKNGKKATNYVLPSSQLLYTATALPYSNKASFKSTLALANQINYQAHNNFSAGAAILLPFFYSIRMQIKGPIGKRVHIGVNNQIIMSLIDAKHRAHNYFITTLGTREAFLNIAVGYWSKIPSERESPKKSIPTLSLAGSFTINDGWRIYAESLVIFDEEHQRFFPAFNISKAYGRNIVEFGIVPTPDFEMSVVPLLSYQRLF